MSAANPRQIAPLATAAPACPRCAYDLSGEVARWTDQCPTTGLCPECGLEVDWRDVLVRKYNHPEWFFETASARRFEALRATARLAFRPHRFWSRVQLNYPVHAGRAIIGGIAGFMWWYALLTIATALLSLLILAVGGSSNRPSPTWHYHMGWPFSWLWPRVYGFPISGLSWWACIGLLILVLMPLAMLLLPASLRKVQVRPAHLLRIAAYSVIYTAILMLAPFLAFRALAGFAAVLDWMRPAEARDSWRAVTLYGPYRTATSVGLPAMTLALLVWPVLWWWPACKHYLELPRPLLISILLSVLCFLFLLTLAIVLMQGRAYRQLFDVFGL